MNRNVLLLKKAVSAFSIYFIFSQKFRHEGGELFLYLKVIFRFLASIRDIQNFFQTLIKGLLVDSEKLDNRLWRDIRDFQNHPYS